MKLAMIVASTALLSWSAMANQIPELPKVELPESNIQPADPMQNYTPSSISERQMRRIWSNMVTELKDKDCFRRAQIWAWNMFDFYNVNSMKIFIHYTNKFNRELDHIASRRNRRGLKDVLDRRLYNMLGYNKTWDYHVAPLVQLDNGEYRVLDKSLVLAYDAKYPYTDNEAWNLIKRPATIEEWTEGLMVRGELLWKARKAMIERDMREASRDPGKLRSLRAKYRELGMDKADSVDIKCHRAESIAEVDLNHNTKYCFYTIAPMYYYTESDLRYLAFGDTNQRYNRPVSGSTYVEQNYLNGAQYFTQSTWNFAELWDARKEFKRRSDSKSYRERIKQAQ